MNVKNLVIGIAVMILTLLVIIYGISMFYSAPDYKDYCPDLSAAKLIDTESECVAVGGEWNSYGESLRDKTTGYCDRSYQCQKEYDTARETYYRNVFLIALPLGIIIILLGLFLFGLESVGAGLIGGGVLSILYGVGGYWRYSADVLKFGLSLIGLVIVIWAAYKFNTRGFKFWKRKKKLFSKI